MVSDDNHSLHKNKIHINHLIEELNLGNLCLFIGAGMSVPAGIPSWNDLIAPIAKELHLKTDDLDPLLLVQYYINYHNGTRSKLTKHLKDTIGVDCKPTEFHDLITKLNIDTFWTTNYDELLERAFAENNIKLDVKHKSLHLSSDRKGSKASLYKMHGTLSNIEEAIISRDDYVTYHIKNQPFLDALSVDLSRQTFLFLGFSFKDRNLQFIFDKMLLSFKEHQRTHYCIFKKPEDNDETESIYFSKNLERHGIRTIWIDNYDEINEIIASLANFYGESGLKSCHSISKSMQALTSELTNTITDSPTDEKLMMLETPMSGMFFSAPPHEDSPYISIGDIIDKDQPLFRIFDGNDHFTITSPGRYKVIDILASMDRYHKENQCIFIIEDHQTKDNNLALPRSKLKLIRATNSGVFWAAEAEGRPKFVDEGQFIVAGQSMYVHEVAKTFDQIQSPVTGIVRRINVENGQEISTDQLLFVIESINDTHRHASTSALAKSPYLVGQTNHTGRFFLRPKNADVNKHKAFILGQPIMEGDVIAYVRHLTHEYEVIAEREGVFREYFFEEGQDVKPGMPIFAYTPHATLAAIRNSFKVQFAGRCGKITWQAKLGHFVSKGEVIAYIENYEIKATHEGILFDLFSGKVLSESQVVCKYYC